MNIEKYFSQNYTEATQRFVENAKKYGKIKYFVGDKDEYAVPVLKIGTGPHKIVINTGMHGLEGFFGSAILNRWLDDDAVFLDKKFRRKFTIVFIHIVNAYGMKHLIRENENNVDLNRNFRDWTIPPPLNRMYRFSHNLLTSKPGWFKFWRLLFFKWCHKNDGIWTAISRGQYEYPDGIFYGGAEAQPEYLVVQQIYDDIMSDPKTKSLLSIGLHTGIGEYKKPTVLVSHPTGHKNTNKFKEIFEPGLRVVPDEKGQVNAADLSGDLVDWLEVRYAKMKIPIWTADLEIGAQTSRISPVLKRMDQGDARWDKLNRGVLSEKTKFHLSEDWAPRDKKWREQAIHVADIFAYKLLGYMEKI